jgi:hypothetical protein
MTRLLDTNVRAIFNDSRQLNRVVTAITLDRGCDYMHALEAFHEAVDGASNEGKSTLRDALKWMAGADPEYLDECVRTFEQRDAAVDAAYQKAAGRVLLEKTDGQGMVLLDQHDLALKPRRVRLGRSRIRSPPMSGRCSRTRRSSNAGSRESAPRSRRSGTPTKAASVSARRTGSTPSPARISSAPPSARTSSPPRAPKADQVAAKLDQAIANAADKRSALKALDREIAQLDRRVRQRLRRLGRPESDYAMALDQEMRGAPMPKAPAKTLDAPVGVVPDSQALHKQIVARMKLLDRPDSMYQQTLEEIMREA